jgi:hypothetical protein
MANDNMYSEVALVSVSKLGGTERNFYTISDSIDFKIGMKDVDFIANLAGGRLDNFKPMEPTEITMKLYPTEMGGANGVFDLFCSNTSDSSQPLSFTVDRGRTKFRVVFLVTDDTSITSAVTAIPIGKSGARLVAQNGYIVEATPQEMTPESGWTWNVRFKFPPFTKAGTGNITGSSTNDDAELPAVASYSA